MAGFDWGAEEEQRLAAIRADLPQVSTASAFQLLNGLGWRNTHLQGLRPLEPLGLGRRLVGRARTCRYLIRREAEAPTPPERRRLSPEIVLIESIEPGDVFCVDALGVPTAGIIGDILAARLKARGVVAAMIYGAVRDTPYIKEVDLPVFTSAIHPAASMRDVVPVDYDVPVNLGGAQVIRRHHAGRRRGSAGHAAGTGRVRGRARAGQGAPGGLDSWQGRGGRLHPRLLPTLTGEGGRVPAGDGPERAALSRRSEETRSRERDAHGRSRRKKAMIGLVVSVRITPERREEFLRVVEEDSRGSREDEPGCLRFDVLQDSQDPDHYFFYEIYRDEDALAAHRQAPHYQPWSAFVGSGGLQSPAEVTRCRTRFPADDAW